MAVLRGEAVHIVDHNTRTSTFYELYRVGPKSNQVVLIGSNRHAKEKCFFVFNSAARNWFL